MDVGAFEAWLDANLAAWVSNDPVDVAALFTEDAALAVGPFSEPWVGRDEIVARWTTGLQDDVMFDHDVLGVAGNIGWRTGTSGRPTPRRVCEDGVRRDPPDHLRARRSVPGPP